MKPQLLCTFTYLDRLPSSLGEIYAAYTAPAINNLKCYMYVENPSNVICVYNVDSNERKLKNTISINRKKETNTFYSINALNNLIRILNNGVLDKTYVIDWAQYRDILLLSEGVDSYKTITIRELAH